jgi:MFS family permease
MTPAGPTALPAARRSRALAVLCAIQLVLQLDFSIVNIALQSIGKDLGTGAATLQWVITGYALTFGSLLLAGGRLGDVFGRRRLLAAGLAVFALASLACGAAPGPAVLIAARLVQGVGAALLAPAVLSTITTLFPEGRERGRALGLWTAANAAGGTSGLVAGGVLTQYLGWRAVFLVNVPLIAFLLPAALRLLPAQPGDRSRRIGAAPALLTTVATGSFILTLSQVQQSGIASPGTLGALAGTAVLAAALVLVERRTATPMLPPGFLASPQRRLGLLAMLAAGGIGAAFPFFVSLWLQRVLGYGQLDAGLAILPAPAALMLTSTLLTPRLLSRTRPVSVMAAGLAAVAAGQLWTAAAPLAGGYPGRIVPGLVLTTFGIGLAFPAISAAVTAGAEPDKGSAAGGLIPTAQQVGAALAIAGLATVAAAADPSGIRPEAGYEAAFYGAAAIAALAATATAIMTVAGQARARGDRARRRCGDGGQVALPPCGAAAGLAAWQYQSLAGEERGQRLARRGHRAVRPGSAGHDQPGACRGIGGQDAAGMVQDPQLPRRDGGVLRRTL